MRRGFTLLELMIVVVIIGVLAMVAIPSFRNYLNRSRTTEAITFLGEIRQRQESYRAEFGQYCAVDGATWPAAYNPNPMPTGGETAAWTSTDNWRMLGAAPDTDVRFSYSTIAGLPGTLPPDGLGYSGTDFWSVSQAKGDLDDDGTEVTFEAYSEATHIWVSSAAGWD